MPRRSGGGMRSAPPRRAAQVPTRAPARAPAPAPTAAAPPTQGPGLMAQMAATAGGVAIGSAVGHAVGNMMSGSGAQETQPQQTQQPQQQFEAAPCEFEMKQFLDCSNRNDLSACEAFNQSLKDCRMRYGI